MKNPAPLLLLLIGAAVAASAEGPADRCDVAWIAKAQAVASRGGTPADPNKYLTTQTTDGAVFPVVNAADWTKLCDAKVWQYLVMKATSTDGDVPFHDDRTKAAWALGLNEQLKIILAVNDLYKLADAQAADAIAKADAVVAAGAKIEKSSGAAPAELKEALSFLLKDGQTAPTPGPGVLAYRKAVVGLASELATHSAGRAFAKARGVDAKMAADFSNPGGSYAAAAKTTAGAYPDAVANDASYGQAAKFLTEPAPSQPASTLGRLDSSLSDKLAASVAAADQAFAAAKKRLNGQTVKATLAAIEHDAQAAAKKGTPDAAPAPGALASAVLEKLKGTKEYSELSSLYDNKSKADPKWADTADAKAAAAQLEAMRKDAAATTIVKSGAGSAVQYSVGGQKVTDARIPVADLKTDKEYSDFVAGSIATVISAGGQTQAVLAALRGKGGPGDAITPPLKPDQQVAAGDLPAKVEKPADKPLAPWEALAKAAPGGGIFGWFSSKETAERYTAQQQESISEAASAAMRARATKERQVNVAAANADRNAQSDSQRQLATSASKANSDVAALKSAPQDPDLSDAEAARVLSEKVAARQKAAAEEQAAIRKAAAEAKAARDAQVKKDLEAAQAAAAAAKAQADAKSKALDETVGKAYDDGISKAEAQLHADYKKPGDDRRSAAEKLSGYTGQFYRVERVDKYFADAWEGDKLPAATAACKTQLGFKLPVASGAGFKDPSADNVDGYCGVRDGLVVLLKSYRGSVGVPVPAPVAAQGK